MSRRKIKVSPWLIAAGLGAVAGTGLLYYLKAGAGADKNSDFIPDAIEDKLDSVVTALNHKFGPAWVQRGLALLEAGLERALPSPLVSLVGIAYRTEEWAREQRSKTGREVTGGEKRSYAAKLVTT